jgi:hypothetical protein
VRRDIELASEKDTYIATLAAKSLYTLLVIRTYFDLEIKQYDIISAFTNSTLDKDI